MRTAARGHGPRRVPVWAASGQAAAIFRQDCSRWAVERLPVAIGAEAGLGRPYEEDVNWSGFKCVSVNGRRIERPSAKPEPLRLRGS